MGDVGEQVMTVNLHPQSRNTILFKTLDRLWETHKLAYIACSFLLILLLIAAIIYVLTRVVVPSERYHFLEQKQAEELRQYLRWRTFGDVLIPSAFRAAIAFYCMLAKHGRCHTSKNIVGILLLKIVIVILSPLLCKEVCCNGYTMEKPIETIQTEEATMSEYIAPYDDSQMSSLSGVYFMPISLRQLHSFDYCFSANKMREFSDDEEGFIPAETEVGHRHATRIAARKQQTQQQRHSNLGRVRYRFSDGFIKKQPPLAYNTPLTLPVEPVTACSHQDHKQKPRTSWETPYKEYCADQSYSLVYCRQSGSALLQQRNYMKNEVSLLNMEDRNSAALKDLKSFEEEGDSGGGQLLFDSKFESGNLHCAFRRRGTNQYHLFISNDTNTLGYNQWFYFSLRNARKGVRYSFRIVNYKKMLDFYRHGQRIALFSLKEAQKSSSGWSWAGNNINFQESSIRTHPELKLFTLHFELQPKHTNDFIMLASTLPYSYSRLLSDLQAIQSQAKSLSHLTFSCTSICSSVCDNQVPEVTITGKEGREKQKRVIIFMARQHPGEVWSSYMALGLMRGLLKQGEQVKYVLENCIIKIYPMINVDGVIYGNFRCDVTGVDLNRRWKQPSKVFHPQVTEIRRRIQALTKKSRVEAVFDLHGHSKKYNIFCYACKHNSYTCRVLPYLIASHNPTFSIPSCTFGVSRDKQTTARATISRILRSQNVLTIETSAFGERVNLAARQFQPNDIYRTAESIICALRFFIDKRSARFQQSEKHIRQNYQQYLNYDRENEEESGSDSQPQLDQIDFKVKLSTIFDKKYNHESRSFAKDSLHNVPLHPNQITFEQPHQSLKLVEKPQLDKIHETIEQQTRKAQVCVLDARETANNQPKRNASKFRAAKQPSPQPKQQRSMSIGKVADPPDMPERAPVPKITLKNILIRDKKRLSYVQDFAEKRQMATISVAQQEAIRSKEFKDLRREEQQRKSIEQFVSKYERLVPGPFKGKGRMDALQEGLDHDDGQFQLNIMLQNKRRLQLQKLKQRIEESTEIAQRQGKVKWNSRKEPIVDYRRFKRNERLRQQVRKLGELSERYLDGQK